ncbi:unnamed protein product [Parnassius apollo]|uniref:(apollo) hypothetical protein n=1 Tax=Parnassius apollo TaxID=110799 RepID=A0A8S3XH79_PARAO|nr:unnamed protein product [Parnassius apollo]
MSGLYNGHAHDEMLDKLSIWDVIVLVVIVMVLVATGCYLFKQLKRHYIKYIQREVKREVEAVLTEGRVAVPQ